MGMGVLRWPPSEFWDATLADLTAALAGYAESKGAGKARGANDVDRDSIERSKSWFLRQARGK